LVVILNILTGILFLPGDLTLTTLGQTPKVPFVSSTHSVTAVSRTVFDLHTEFWLSSPKSSSSGSVLSSRSEVLSYSTKF
jgi:hypothetical protein